MNLNRITSTVFYAIGFGIALLVIIRLTQIQTGVEETYKEHKKTTGINAGIWQNLDPEAYEAYLEDLNYE